MDSPAQFMDRVRERDPEQPEFHQAVCEVVNSLWPFLTGEGQRYREARVFERLVEPDRVIQFRVAWVDDAGELQINRGFRVQQCGVIGPYKGGLRFHPSVDLGVLKFLAFEQVLKNALTTLPLGGAKGGSDFDPKGKSDAEVMRFCQSFMTELYRDIGPDTDVPAGDIGVGTREIGYLFGHYRRITRRFDGVLTGKALAWGGSLIRPEATGYGVVYFARNMLAAIDEELAGKRVAISGAGNVAQHAAEKAIALGATVVSLSDSDGCVHDPEGIDADKLGWVSELVNQRRGRIREYAEHFGVDYYPAGGEAGGEAGEQRGRPWSIPCDLALPCATQNELDEADADCLIANGCLAVVEGANMPATTAAIARLRAAKLLFGPGKAANAGGVATSGLEMAQNSQRMVWSRERVDAELQTIMDKIHAACCAEGRQGDGTIDYVVGANVAAFKKVAAALYAQGV